MKERPILFSAAMVNAILDGRKTQTRRVVSATHYDRCSGTLPCNWDTKTGREVWLLDGEWKPCPYGQPGDHLWVRETWRYQGADLGAGKDASARIEYRADGTERICHVADFARDTPKQRERKNGESYLDYQKYLTSTFTVFRPSIFMPRWASRILLEIDAIRVERLQDISEEDSKAEGVGFGDNHIVNGFGELDGKIVPYSAAKFYPPGQRPTLTARSAFCSLWNSINLKPKPIYTTDAQDKVHVAYYVSFPWSNEHFDAKYPSVRASGIYRGKPLKVTENPYVWAITFRRVP